MLSRRETLKVIGSFTACAMAAPASLAGTAGRSLREAANAAGLTFGTSIAQDALDDPGLGDLYAREAAVLTADWAMKFDWLRPAEDVLDTSHADLLLAYADRAGLSLRGHTLAWNESRPDWLMSLSTNDMARALDRHIDDTVSHFAGRVWSWDVVNEPFWPGHELDGGWRDGPWIQAFGTGYVKRAFRRAAAADPNARLILNEAHTEQWTETGAGIRAGLLRLIDELLDAGVRLDAVGLQGHLIPQWDYDDAGFADFLWQIAERGVEIHITELDVDDSSFPDDVALRDQMVARRYRDFLGAVLQVPAVTTVITWQLADPASHYAWAAREAGETRRPRPLPFDAALAPKPAHAAMMAAFAARRRD